MKLYKVLAAGRRSCHGGTQTWVPGQWYTVEGDLVPCENGLHLCRAGDILNWLHDETWHADARGQRIVCADKVVVRSARITTRTALDATSMRLFAADCAERALAEAKVRDPRCHEAVRAARLFAGGLIDGAAWDAARAAARAAAGAAARDAAWAAAGDAARDAAWAAAWAAARDAARDAAWETERVWQTKRLVAYMEGRVNIERIIATALAAVA